MADPRTVTLDVVMTINGERYAGALVVEPGDHLVVNLGEQASVERLARAREHLDRVAPGLVGRVLFLEAAGMAVIRDDAQGG